MTKKYSECFYCGGAVGEQLMPRELRWQGQLCVLENVPMGVCTQYGEKVLRPEVAKAIDRVLQEEKKPARTMQVPIYLYKSDVV
jgi:YgiT-type zinc finger domain-containing protein